MKLITEAILKNVTENTFQHKHFSQEKIDTISQSNLIQLTLWIDETLIEERNNRFALATEENIIIYENMAFDHYSGECYPPILFLQKFLGYTFPQAAYLLNYFYYKVPKAPLSRVVSTARAQSHAAGAVADLDLNYILKEDKLNSQTDKGYALKRVIAYLCDTRHIDKDIVLNLIKQGFLKLDKANNLCFLTFSDPVDKESVIAITKHGTVTATATSYKCNLVKEHNTGFLYARKSDLEATAYQEIYVFESVIDLLSYLTLVKRRYIPAAEGSACYIALNGVGNRGYLHRILTQYPTLQSVMLCLDNDSKGIQAMRYITEEISNRSQGISVEDFQLMLKSVSKRYTYCKDWNDVVCLAARTDGLIVE